MNHKIQNYLGAAAILSTLLIGFAAFTYSSAYSKSIQPSNFRSFSVTGEGKIVAVPDIAQFNFSVITEGGKDFAALQRENTEKINKIIAFVKAQGVDSKDIKTEGYNLQPRTQYFTCRPETSSTGAPVKACPPPEITGYTITQSVTVKIRDFNKIGQIISGVVTNGANSTNGPFFTIDEPAVLQNQAREEAIAKAKESAKAIARAGGFRLGRLLSIDESGYYPFQKAHPESLGRGSAGTDMAAPTPSIEPGSQDVTMTVTLRYEIE